MATYVNLDQIREIIQELLRFRHLKIRDLDRVPSGPMVKRKFNQLIQLIDKIKRSDAYDQIFKIVESETRNCNSIDPGTIGAYFKGCLLPVNFPDNPSCSEVCVASFQPPGTIDGWSNCGRIVIRVKWDCFQHRPDGPSVDKDPTATINLIAKGENPGYLLIDHTTLSEFPGFSNQEISEFKRLGLNNCKLLSVSSSGREYRDLLGGFHSVDNLPSRVSRRLGPDTEEDPEGRKSVLERNPWILMSFFVLLLLGIGIFSLLQLSSSQAKTEGQRRR